MPRIAEIDGIIISINFDDHIAPEYLYNIAVDTLRARNRSQWGGGEPYSEEVLRPHFP